MALVNDNSFVEDARSLLVGDTRLTNSTWTRASDDDPMQSGRDVIVSLRRYLEERPGPKHSGKLGIEIPNDTRLAAIAELLPQVELISITFPDFADGRGFSLAKQLRAAGFKGELRAHGPLVADQFPFALGCGFDTVEVPASVAVRQPPDQWLCAERSITEHYQTGYYSQRSILQERYRNRSATIVTQRVDSVCCSMKNDAKAPLAVAEQNA